MVTSIKILIDEDEYNEILAYLEMQLQGDRDAAVVTLRYLMDKLNMEIEGD